MSNSRHFVALDFESEDDVAIRMTVGGLEKVAHASKGNGALFPKLSMS